MHVDIGVLRTCCGLTIETDADGDQAEAVEAEDKLR